MEKVEAPEILSEFWPQRLEDGRKYTLDGMTKKIKKTLEPRPYKNCR